MKRDEVLRRLREHQAELNAAGIEHLSLFGSVVRGEERPDSDVDLLAELGKPIGLFALVGLERTLATMLGVRVDLCTNLREPSRTHALGEAVRAF